MTSAERGQAGRQERSYDTCAKDGQFHLLENLLIEQSGLEKKLNFFFFLNREVPPCKCSSLAAKFPKSSKTSQSRLVLFLSFHDLFYCEAVVKDEVCFAHLLSFSSDHRSDSAMFMGVYLNL